MPEGRDTLAGWRPLIKGSSPFDAVAFHVQVSRVVVSESVHRFANGRGDNYLHYIALPGRGHLQRGGGAAATSTRDPPWPRTTMGVVPEQGLAST